MQQLCIVLKELIHFKLEPNFCKSLSISLCLGWISLLLTKLPMLPGLFE